MKAQRRRRASGPVSQHVDQHGLPDRVVCQGSRHGRGCVRDRPVVVCERNRTAQSPAAPVVTGSDMPANGQAATAQMSAARSQIQCYVFHLVSLLHEKSCDSNRPGSDDRSKPTGHRSSVLLRTPGHLLLNYNPVSQSVQQGFSHFLCSQLPDLPAPGTLESVSHHAGMNQLALTANRSCRFFCNALLIAAPLFSKNPGVANALCMPALCLFLASSVLHAFLRALIIFSRISGSAHILRVLSLIADRTSSELNALLIPTDRLFLISGSFQESETFLLMLTNFSSSTASLIFRLLSSVWGPLHTAPPVPPSVML